MSENLWHIHKKLISRGFRRARSAVSTSTFCDGVILIFLSCSILTSEANCAGQSRDWIASWAASFNSTYIRNVISKSVGSMKTCKYTIHWCGRHTAVSSTWGSVHRIRRWAHLSTNINLEQLFSLLYGTSFNVCRKWRWLGIGLMINTAFISCLG